MTVLGISGTPRAGGNAQLLLDAALAPFTEQNWDVIRVLLSEQSIAPCVGCESCRDGRGCRIRDGMQAVYGAYQACDAVVIASPVYWRNVPAQLKALFDRSFAVRDTKPLAGKLGGAIAVGRGAGGGQTVVLNIIYSWFLSCGALCVPGELNGVSAVADRPGDILDQPGRLKQARILGGNIIKYARR